MENGGITRENGGGGAMGETRGGGGGGEEVVEPGVTSPFSPFQPPCFPPILPCFPPCFLWSMMYLEAKPHLGISRPWDWVRDV